MRGCNYVFDLQSIFSISFRLLVRLCWIPGVFAGTSCEHQLLADGELRAARERTWLQANRPLIELLQAIIASGAEAPTERIVLYAVRRTSLGLRLLRRRFRSRWYTDEEFGEKWVDWEEDLRRVEAVLLQTLELHTDVPETELVLLFADLAYTVPGPDTARFCAEYPCFTFSVKREGPPELIGFPNPYFICRLNQQARRVAWHKKLRKTFWIGSLSSPIPTTWENASTWARLPRVRLASIAKLNTRELDIGFVRLDLATSEYRMCAGKGDYLKDVFEHAPRSRFRRLSEAAPKYKYLLNVDGVAASWRGLDLLSAHGVMLLQDSRWGEFFYRDLRPMHDFVPVAHDLSNLVSRTIDLQKNDAAAEEMAGSGFKFQRERLSLSATLCWIRAALQFMADVRAISSCIGVGNDLWF